MLASSKRRKEQTGDGEGQALVEFAFVAMFLLLVIFGIIDFARLFFAYATMSNGAREGARFGIVRPNDDAEIEARARAMMVLIGSEANVTIEYPGGDPGDDAEAYPAGCTTPHHCRIQIIVTSDFDMWTPVIPSLSLEARATMHFE
jgi:hypothetical protein